MRTNKREGQPLSARSGHTKKNRREAGFSFMALNLLRDLPTPDPSDKRLGSILASSEARRQRGHPATGRQGLRTPAQGFLTGRGLPEYAPRP